MSCPTPIGNHIIGSSFFHNLVDGGIAHTAAGGENGSYQKKWNYYFEMWKQSNRSLSHREQGPGEVS